MALADEELLDAVGVLVRGKLTVGGVLLAGSRAAIAEHVPNYAWTHLRMRSDLEYQDREDDHDAIPVALLRVMDRILADNPVQTVRQGLFHFEYRTYPEIAVREALLNAFCHADYRLASPILIKQYPDKIEISNPGGLIGGITPDNILHHTPMARNPSLVEALVRLRLVNRSNLGVQRMFQALLIEGKEPPRIEDLGEALRLTFRSSSLSPAFRQFVAEEDSGGIKLSVDDLLILQHLLRHAEVDSLVAARICQRPPHDAKETLSRMERDLGYLERGGTGRGTYWRLRASVHERIAAPGTAERDQRLDWEAAKTRALSILKQRAEQGDSGLANGEIRAITLLDRHQVVRLLRELRREVPQIRTRGHGAGARYYWEAEQ